MLVLVISGLSLRQGPKTTVLKVARFCKIEISYKHSFPGAQTVKNLPAMQETWVRSLGQEDTLEEGMATHSSLLAWRILWTEEPGRLQSMGRKE